MSQYANRVVMTVTGTPGTGTVTLNAATSGFQTFGAAFGANAPVDVFITDGAAWEVARNCTYTHSGTTLTRGTREASSTGAALSLTSAAVVTLTLTAAQITDYDGLWASLGGDTISVTTTATATIGQMHVCTGTSADYTVTLPAAAGNSGRFVGFQMGAGLSKLVTLDAGAGVNIDGATTTLAAGITAAATSVTVASATGFPTRGQYLVQVASEQMLITGGQGTTTWTVTRGVAGTTAAAQSNAASVSQHRTRTMWRGEKALLRSDGADWFKMSGPAVGMMALSAPSANQTIAAAGDLFADLNVAVLDPTGLICDTANNRLFVPRSGVWQITPVGRINNVQTANFARFFAGVWQMRGSVETLWIVLAESGVQVQGYPIISLAVPRFQVEGDTLRLRAGINSASAQTLFGNGTTEGSFLLIQEQTPW